MTDKELLIKKARQAGKQAYAPYSRFRVGAALLTKSGRIFTGSNVENASYGLTVCAERVAIFKAVSAGEKRFKAMGVVISSRKKTRPCGACLQVMNEFSDNLILYLSSKNKTETKKLSDLLPNPFTL
ncbi:MAG: cytidine deaminase [Planctomycetes bacterium]|nr:cytidine deaminase [Planctomycetota bacterium]MCK5579288.1 cytidine deaminase [Planctomycetota bacterium]